MINFSTKRQRGFTLIELMIVMLIAAILAAIVVPSYQGYLARSKRSQAKSLLLQVADKQEQFFLDNKRYALSLTDLGYAADPLFIDKGGEQMTTAGDEGIYQLTFGAAANVSYTATAAPLAGQSKYDAKCGTLSLSHTGRRDQSGTATDCW